MFDQHAYPSSSLLTAIVCVDSLMRERMREAGGIGTTEYRALSALRRCPDGMSASKLAETVGVSPTAITSATKFLVAHGLVTRTRDQRDLRCVTLNVTPAALHVLDETDEALALLVRELWHGMDYTLAPFSLAGTARIDDTQKPELSRTGSKFVSLFFETYYLSKRVICDALAPLALTINGYRVLRELCVHGSMRLKSLSNELLLRANTLSATVGELADVGMLTRAESGDDLRSFFAVPSALGIKTGETATEAVRLAMTTYPYETSEEEQAAFNTQAECIVRNLRGGLWRA